MLINVDIDGVIYDFTAQMYAELRFAGFEAPLMHPDRWEIWEAWGIPKDTFYDVFHRGVLEGRVFAEGPAIPGAKEALKELWKTYKIRLVTAKILDGTELRAAALKNTVEFLRSNKIKYHELVFAGHDKQGYPADVVVDDKPQTEGWAQPGALNLLFDQAWNQDFTFDRIAPIRVFGWEDVMTRLGVTA